MDRVVGDVVEGECHDAVYFLSVFTGRDDGEMGKVLERRIVKLFCS